MDQIAIKFYEDEDRRIAYRQLGSGKPLLLLHGYPQSGLMWHKVAKELARHYLLIIPDLRGYGQSFHPPLEDDHSSMSFRSMASDMMALMKALAHEDFFVCGHDRGARVAHRLAQDWPKAVSKLMLLDIVPTLYLYDNLNQKRATAYFHWLFLLQDPPLPEDIIADNPRRWLDTCLSKWSGIEPHGQAFQQIFEPKVYQSYLSDLSDIALIESTTEDYRAGATIDLEHDRASLQNNEKILCPTQVLWGEKGVFGLDDVCGIWQTFCSAPVQGKALPCGHFIPEERPHDLVRHCLDFFT